MASRGRRAAGSATGAVRVCLEPEAVPGHWEPPGAGRGWKEPYTPPGPVEGAQPCSPPFWPPEQRARERERENFEREIKMHVHLQTCTQQTKWYNPKVHQRSSEPTKCGVCVTRTWFSRRAEVGPDTGAHLGDLEAQLGVTDARHPGHRGRPLRTGGPAGTDPGPGGAVAGDTRVLRGTRGLHTVSVFHDRALGGRCHGAGSASLARRWPSGTGGSHRCEERLCRSI